MIAIAPAALACSRTLAAKRTPPARPNIVVIITDDQDKMSLGPYGGKSYTPNIDKMAAEGIVFDRAYVNSTVCTPSRYSFLTGRHAGRSYQGCYTEEHPRNTQGFPSFNMQLEDDNMNVGSVLAANGYATGYVGKFHVGPDIKRREDYEAIGLPYVGTDAKPDAAATDAFAKQELWARRYLRQKGFTWAKNIYWANMRKPFAKHNPHWTVDAALEFITAHKDRPFYLHYCTTLTHGPDKSWSESMNHPRVSGRGMLEKAPDVMTDRKTLLKRLRDRGLDPEKGHAGYALVDDSVGAILKRLDELGIGENTLVVFVSDHGSSFKGSLFDLDGVCVPCIMRWPRAIKPGRRSDRLIQNIDFVPTFFDLADAKVPKNYITDGRSLRRLFDSPGTEDWRRHLYFELGFARAVATDRYKYIAVRYTAEQIDRIRNAPARDLPKLMSYIARTGIGTRGAEKPGFFDYDQLYDLAADPKELNNLAGDRRYARRLSQMRALLKKELQSFDRPFGELIPGPDTAGPGRIDEQIALVKKIKIQGRTIIVPPAATDTPTRPAKDDKRPQRQKRRADKSR